MAVHGTWMDAMVSWATVSYLEPRHLCSVLIYMISLWLCAASRPILPIEWVDRYSHTARAGKQQGRGGKKNCFIVFYNCWATVTANKQRGVSAEFPVAQAPTDRQTDARTAQTHGHTRTHTHRPETLDRSTLSVWAEFIRNGVSWM